MNFSVELLEALAQSKIVTLFTHVNPDGDALGSQWGLKYWLNLHYPAIQVYVLNEGNVKLDQFFQQADQLENEVIKSSLAIILDTANQERISDQRALEASSIVKIDHHPNLDDYGQLSLVDETAASTTELLTRLFHGYQKPLNLAMAQALLIGLLTDTLNFSTPSVKKQTLLSAAYLLNYEPALASLMRQLDTVSLAVYQFETHLRQIIQFEAALAYAVVKQADYQSFNLSMSMVKESVNVMNNIAGIKLWALFVEDEIQADLYHGSLRSATQPVNGLAQQFAGGGHPLAAGVKNLSLTTLTDLLNELRALSDQ